MKALARIMILLMPLMALNMSPVLSNEKNVGRDSLANETSSFVELRFTPEAKKKLYSDIEMSKKAAMAAGTSRIEMEKRGRVYIEEIQSHANANMRIDAEQYELIRDELFKKIVVLNIRSRPDGARVAIAGLVVGVTPLDQQMHSGKQYEFVFSKLGYEDASSRYYVSPYPSHQEVVQELKEQVTDMSGTPESLVGIDGGR